MIIQEDLDKLSELLDDCRKIIKEKNLEYKYTNIYTTSPLAFLYCKFGDEINITIKSLLINVYYDALNLSLEERNNFILMNKINGINHTLNCLKELYENTI